MCILAVVNKLEAISTETRSKTDLKAMSFIELYLSHELTCNIVEDRTTMSTWEKLEKFYMFNTLSNKLCLKINC